MKTLDRNYFWRLIPAKVSHLTVTEPLIPTHIDTNGGCDRLLLWVLQVGAKFVFGQGNRALGTVVVSILLLEAPLN
jgi:hypothetical protein